MRIIFTDSDADYKKIFGEFLLQRIGIQYPPLFSEGPHLNHQSVIVVRVWRLLGRTKVGGAGGAYIISYDITTTLNYDRTKGLLT